MQQMYNQEVISQTTYENDGAYKCEGAEDAEGLKVYWQGEVQVAKC